MKNETEAKHEMLERIQGEALDVMRDVESISGHVSCAVDCETLEDVTANLAEALSEARELVKTLSAMLKSAKGKGD